MKYLFAFSMMRNSKKRTGPITMTIRIVPKPKEKK